jgi:N-acetyl sugar amidotransferase
MNQPKGTFKTCNFCVLDSSLEMLEFDNSGQCFACKDALERMPYEWLRGDEGKEKLIALAERLKREGHGQPYDAMIGLSGGIDSAYLAHMAVKQMGLRVLAVHVDGGWNSATAVRNIELLVRSLDLDLHTVVIEWEEMRDIQLSFLRSSVHNQDIPQDHAFFSTLYRTASKFGIRDFLSGVNFASEGVFVDGLGYAAMDGYHIKQIHRKFGELELKSFPIMGLFELVWTKHIRKQLRMWKPLDLLYYNKEDARRVLVENYGWLDYGKKHCESRFTKFYQETYLPSKFRFDKRKFHLSSLIVSGQMTREKAIVELSQPIVDELEANRDTKFIAKKLGITHHELIHLITSPVKSHLDYPNHHWILRLFEMAKAIIHALNFR